MRLYFLLFCVLFGSITGQRCPRGWISGGTRLQCLKKIDQPWMRNYTEAHDMCAKESALPVDLSDNRTYNDFIALNTFRAPILKDRPDPTFCYQKPVYALLKTAEYRGEYCPGILLHADGCSKHQRIEYTCVASPGSSQYLGVICQWTHGKKMHQAEKVAVAQLRAKADASELQTGLLVILIFDVLMLMIILSILIYACRATGEQRDFLKGIRLLDRRLLRQEMPPHGIEPVISELGLHVDKWRNDRKVEYENSDMVKFAMRREKMISEMGSVMFIGRFAQKKKSEKSEMDETESSGKAKADLNSKMKTEFEVVNKVPRVSSTNIPGRPAQNSGGATRRQTSANPPRQSFAVQRVPSALKTQKSDSDPAGTEDKTQGGKQKDEEIESL